jgi:hypothetical protein
MGLLGENFEDPKTLAILGVASGLLGAAGPRTGPRSMFGDIGQALQGGLQGYGAGLQFKNQAARQKLLENQAQMQMSQMQRQQRLQDSIMSAFGGGSPQGEAQAPQMPGPSPVEQQSLMPSDGAPFNIGPSQMGGPPQQAAPMRGGAAGEFPLSLNQVAMLKAMGGPDMLDHFKFAQQGAKFEGGAMYRMPNGQTVMLPKLGEGMAIGSDGTVANAPGYVSALAGAEGAKTAAAERAKAGFDMTMVPTRDGGSIPMSRLDALNAARGGGGIPGAPASGFGAQTPGDKAYSEDAAKAASNMYGQLQEAGRQAPSQIAKYQQLDQLLANHDGGKLSPLGLDIASAANSLGIKLDKNLGNKEAAAALANEMALQLRNPAGGAGMPGAMSDADRNFLVSMIPSISSSAQGRSQMVQMRVQMLKRDQEVSTMANKWQQRFGRIDAPDATGKTFQDYLAQYSEARPLFAPAQQ